MFFDEHVDFVYNYGADYLIYSFNPFFTDVNVLIDNKWGTICLIDENGCADFSCFFSEGETSI